MAIVSPLAQFLESNELSQAQFSRRFGFNIVTVNDWVRGRRSPSLASALRIERATAGAIPVKAWLKKRSAA